MHQDVIVLQEACNRNLNILEVINLDNQQKNVTPEEITRLVDQFEPKP